MRAFCTDPDCLSPVFRSGLCRGHVARRQRGAVVAGGLARQRWESPWERLLEAVAAYADCDTADDEAYARAEDRLRKAAKAWATGIRGHRAGSKPDLSARRMRYRQRARVSALQLAFEFEVRGWAV